MDNFGSSNNNFNGLRKLGKALVYMIVIAVVFVGGGAFYKYVFQGLYDENITRGNTAPVTAEVTPEVVAAPTPVPTLTVAPKSTSSPVPAQSVTPAPTQSLPPTPAATAKPKITQRQRILEDMHKLINTKVVADFVWGEVPITEENVEKLIEEVSETTFPDRDKLLTLLENWRNGDFENAVNDHNYIWEQLGGTIGKATALRERSR